MIATASRPRGKRALPIDETAGGYTTRPQPTDTGTDLVDPQLFTPRHLARWEVGRLELAVLRSEAWWLRFFAKERVPLDTALPVINSLVDWILCEGICRVLDPDAYRVEGVPEDTIDPSAEGLSVQPLPGRREKPKPAIHPGCQRHLMVDGERCGNLRRYGERLCPTCGREYLRAHRGAA